MDEINGVNNKLRNPPMTKGSHHPSVHWFHIIPFGQIPDEQGKEFGDGKGISSPGSARCCPKSPDWLADVMNGVFVLYVQIEKSGNTH